MAGKIVRKEPKGLARRRAKLVKSQLIQEQQQEYRLDMLEMVTYEDIEVWKQTVMDGMARGNMRAAALFAEQVMGQTKQESHIEVVDVAAVLKQKRKAMESILGSEEEAPYDVDVKPVEK